MIRNSRLTLLGRSDTDVEVRNTSAWSARALVALLVPAACGTSRLEAPCQFSGPQLTAVQLPELAHPEVNDCPPTDALVVAVDSAGGWTFGDRYVPFDAHSSDATSWRYEMRHWISMHGGGEYIRRLDETKPLSPLASSRALVLFAHAEAPWSSIRVILEMIAFDVFVGFGCKCHDKPSFLRVPLHKRIGIYAHGRADSAITVVKSIQCVGQGTFDSAEGASSSFVSFVFRRTRVSDNGDVTQTLAAKNDEEFLGHLSNISKVEGLVVWATFSERAPWNDCCNALALAVRTGVGPILVPNEAAIAYK